MCELDNEFGALTNSSMMLQWFDLVGIANKVNFASVCSEQCESKW